ncbi:hypothetical protein ABW19_dt0208426 [Dactylella cylindrospora]|nr:hypothetical protein ABW19_dt0208426 [Dactylella cylindrospora]
MSTSRSPPPRISRNKKPPPPILNPIKPKARKSIRPPKLAITKLIPEEPTALWSIVSRETLCWPPTQLQMPDDLESEHFEVLRWNRANSYKLRDHQLMREAFDSHLSGIIEHCYELASGKITKSEGNAQILSLADPLSDGMRSLWAEFPIRERGLQEATRDLVDEFIDAVQHFDPASNIYHHVVQRLNKQLDEILRIAHYAYNTTVAIMQNIVLEDGIKYQPFDEEELYIISEIIDLGAEVQEGPVTRLSFRADALETMQRVRKTFSVRRLKTVEARCREARVEYSEKIILTPVCQASKPLSTKQRKLNLLKHQYNFEVFLNSLWREIILGMEYCISGQLNCLEWVTNTLDRFQSTAEAIKWLRRQPDMSLYINLKEKRMGKKISKWDT